MLNGIDVSGWQPKSITVDVDYDFVIIKATEGCGFVSPVCDTQYQAAKKRGKLLGVYHFASTGNSPSAEAKFFYDSTQGYIGEAIFVLDFEAGAVNQWGDAGARQFLDTFYQLSGVKPLIYTSSSVAKTLFKVAEGDYGLWVADWGNNQASGFITPHGVNPYPFKVLAIHQYTSRGKLPGYSGDLDLNIAYMDKNAWYKYAGSSNKNSETPPTSSGTLKSVDELVQEIWDGKWGNGQNRIDLLTKAGYNAEEIQKAVNASVNNNFTSYTVKAGDTLSGIGATFGIPWTQIQKDNNIKNPNLIYSGQILKIKRK